MKIGKSHERDETAKQEVTNDQVSMERIRKQE